MEQGLVKQDGEHIAKLFLAPFNTS
ncbi:hypothetical protein RRG08_006754 [Elysia crispata]|uniref:Uncharacterized protein n=1 Tax=Elysia crispata TaxID=231223 RepID=A0AAE0ZNW1_9GAST|nr:hypothetical protein RRG08_006754 [Elysia crispata]